MFKRLRKCGSGFVVLLSVVSFLTGYFLCKPIHHKNTELQNISPRYEVHKNGDIKNTSSEISIKKVFTFTKEEQWMYNSHVCANLESQVGTEDFPKQYLNTPYGPISLYTQNIKSDGISKKIYTNKLFEPKLDKIIRYFMSKHQDAGFIDIGANMGVRSLQVSVTGSYSISVEALDENVQRLCASVKLNKLEENMIIVHNAISDEHSLLNIAVSERGRRGGTYIDDPQTRKMKQKMEGKGQYKAKKKVFSMTLDDLLELPNFYNRFSKVFMKLDVEGFEHKVIAGGKRFFEKVNVIGIVMEWRWHREQRSATTMIKRFKTLNFEPFKAEIQPLKRLKWYLYDSWPQDVLWLPSK